MLYRSLAAMFLAIGLSQTSSAWAQQMAFYVPVSTAAVVPATTVARPVSIRLVGYTDSEAVAYASNLAAASHPVISAPVLAGTLVASPVTLTLSDYMPVVTVWPQAAPVAVAPVIYP